MEFTEGRKRLIIIGTSLVFIAVNTLFVANEFYWFTLFPLVIVLLAMFFLSLDKVFLLTAFFTPLSIDISFKDAGLVLTLPTEPLLMGMLLLLLLKFLYQNPFTSRVWFHPVSIIIILQLIWMLVTSVTSELPGVSFKYLASRIWFVVPLYFLAILVFQDQKRIRQFLLLFLVPLAGVVIYTTYQHSLLGFGGRAAHWVMYPFFNDHTAYGAILAMFLPVGIAFTLDKEYDRSVRLIFAILTTIILLGLILSVSRAAWLSVFAAMVFFLILRFRIKFKVLALVGLGLIALILTFQNQIIERMAKNTQESEESDIKRHAQSMSNITTDASNLERINRWKAAQRMIEERPFLGWGPGTYQFVYAPYQHSTDLTIISTNAGDMGNVHSEYIGPLCDSGIIGGILKLALVIAVIAFTLKVLHNEKLDPRLRIYLMAVFLGLTTYYVHGFLNNFLDTDKASVPFWGFTAIIIAIDIYHSEARKIIKPDSDQEILPG